MAESYIQLPADGSGKKVRSSSAGAENIHTQYVLLDTTAGNALVTAVISNTVTALGTFTASAMVTNLVTAIGISVSGSVLTTSTGSATTTTVLTAETSRKAGSIFNDSSQNVYVKFGTGAATNDFTLRLLASGYYEFPQPIYNGAVAAIQATANGTIRVTENI